MKHRSLAPRLPVIVAFATLATTLVAGCMGPKIDLAQVFYRGAATSAPLGSLSDPVWMDQEEGAEVSKFVVYDHEFKLNSNRLNTGGEDHVKQIAARVQAGAPYPVIIERSMNSKATGTHHFPVAADPELDMKRREVIVRALHIMGVADADERVIVAPAVAEGLTSVEAENAYRRGMQSSAGSGAFGNGFGGFGGFGGGGVGGGVF